MTHEIPLEPWTDYARRLSTEARDRIATRARSTADRLLSTADAYWHGYVCPAVERAHDRAALHEATEANRIAYGTEDAQDVRRFYERLVGFKPLSEREFDDWLKARFFKLALERKDFVPPWDPRTYGIQPPLAWPLSDQHEYWKWLVDRYIWAYPRGSNTLQAATAWLAARQAKIDAEVDQLRTQLHEEPTAETLASRTRLYRAFESWCAGFGYDPPMHRKTRWMQEHGLERGGRYPQIQTVKGVTMFEWAPST